MHGAEQWSIPVLVITVPFLFTKALKSYQMMLHLLSQVNTTYLLPFPATLSRKLLLPLVLSATSRTPIFALAK